MRQNLRLLSILRLVFGISIIFSFYQYFGKEIEVFLYVGLMSIIGLLVAVRIYSRLSFKAKIDQNLLVINEEELNYQEKSIIPNVDNGNEFRFQASNYAYDLDFFGEKSIYHHVNRTYTYYGKKQLAERLRNQLEYDEILKCQEAISELKEKIDFRQRIGALAKNIKSGEKEHLAIKSWLSKKQNLLNYKRILAYLGAGLLILFLILYLFTDQSYYLNLCSYLFVFNLSLLGGNFKSIKSELIDSDYIVQNLKTYSLIFEVIEQEEFKSELLKEYQSSYKSESLHMSKEIKELSSLVNELNSVQNLFVSVVFNGLLSYHTHVLYRLLNWKRNCRFHLLTCLELVGEIEANNSLANFAYNHPDYCMPSLNKEEKIAFEQVGHPLIHSDKRVNNDIDFNVQPFIILTGSNMSGKSTFLRSLGINMVLASIGSVICAKSANLDPLKILVSMRLEDSIADETSYFYAEVKKLKSINDHLEEKPSFIILDEILRGTNSEDKQNGTIEYIKRLVTNKAIGIIATHDLEVCKLSEAYPEYIDNKCFEAKIIDDSLIFDYELRSGICQSKSATFLMKKLKVI